MSSGVKTIIALREESGSECLWHAKKIGKVGVFRGARQPWVSKSQGITIGKIPRDPRSALTPSLMCFYWPAKVPVTFDIVIF